MRKMKKFTGLLLLAALLWSLSFTGIASAATQRGSITIDNAVDGQTYTIYKMLYLESFDPTLEAYPYKATAAWADFINSAEVKDVYLSIDENGYVSKYADAEDSSFAEFAKLAKEYAKTNNITPSAQKAADGTTVEFTNLELGYYLVDTSLGALCNLTTTKPDASINEKNEGSSIEKKINENGQFVDENDVYIGDTVEYQTTIKAKAGAEKYVLHDVLSAGLTLNKASIKVEGTALTDANGNAVENAIGTVSFDTTDGCTFEITFKQAYLDTITESRDIIINYSAVLNESAVIALPGNPNKTKLTYGDDNATTWDETITYTYDLKVFKYGNDDKNYTLEGVTFVLLNSAKDKVAVVENGKFVSWNNIPEKNAAEEIIWPAESILSTDADGRIQIVGLDAGKYYLRELETLAGFNKLGSDAEIEIDGVNESGEYLGVTAEINNKSGAELPQTGGIGTHLFYAAGISMVVVATGLFFAKKYKTAKR